MATRQCLLFSSLWLFAGLAFGQLTGQMTNLPLPNTYPPNWGPIATNTCAANAGIVGTFVAGIKTITGTGTVGTMVMTSNGLGAPSPCGIPGAYLGPINLNVAITISGTNTCYDGPQTITGTTAGSTLTFATTCTTNFSAIVGQTTPYEIGSQPMRDTSGNIWVTFGFGNGNGDVPQTIAARESTDGGNTFGGFVPIIADTTLSCSSGSQCAMNGQASGVAANGNLVVVTGVFDRPLGERLGVLWETIYNGTSWAPYFVANTAIPPGQPSTWGWCWAMSHIFPLPGGALGLEVIGDVGPGPLNCGGSNVYILVSCDNGASWGTGAGCTGGMAQFAGTNSVILVALGSSGNWPTTESNIAWVGGTTLLGFLRTNLGSQAAPQPLVMFYSTNMGATWTFTNTGIVGQAVNAATTTYTEISPWLYNTGIGGLWTLFYGDRPNSGSYSQIVRQLTFNPQAAIANPLGLGVGQFLWGAGTGALGCYPGVIQGANPYTVLVWSDEYPTTVTNVRRIRQWSATYIPSSGTMTVQ